MQDQASVTASTDILVSQKSPIFSAATPGVLIVFAIGLSPMEVVHNTAHDVCHSIAFSCH
ncbi:MAG: CbtB domain-containing protein [Spongiibacteraceae bacterium]